MKKRYMLFLIFVLVFLTFLFVYKINNFNVLALDTIPLPQAEKFDIKILKIEKYKVWEMKNVYLYNGDYWFENSRENNNRFYMTNKIIEDINDFSIKFIAQIDSNFGAAKEGVINYYFYRKSKRLPKYWTPVWDRHCIDELTDHEEDLLFIVTTDINKNILNIDIKKKE